MTAKQFGAMLSILGAFLFFMSEFSKDPKQRILLSQDSKIAVALAETVSTL